jgi:hypothetical protein
MLGSTRRQNHKGTAPISAKLAVVKFVSAKIEVVKLTSELLDIIVLER